MINYGVQTDEKLVELYQTQNDQDAFNELFDRYKLIIENKSKKASSNTGIDLNLLLTQNMDMFWKAVKKYNPARGAAFRSYLFWKLKNSTHDVIKSMYRNTSSGRVVMSTVDHRTLTIAQEVDMDDSLAVEDIYNHLKSHGEKYPIFLKLLAEGYTYEEIGKVFGKQGSPEAIRMWGHRMKTKIAKLVSEYYAEQGIQI